MKKLGFTLSEILVALGLVAVVAMITAPLIENILPDRNKLAVLKAYKIINDITGELLENPDLYRRRECHSSLNLLSGAMCTGLGDVTEASSGDMYGVVTVENKYPQLFAVSLGLDIENNITNTFTTDDNVTWIFERRGPELIDSSDSYSLYGCDYIITIDLDGDGDSGQFAVRNADRYRFRVRYDGFISGDDDLTKQYLKTSDKLNNRREDYREAGIN